MIKLLLVEDDANLAYIEKSSLEEIVGGYEVRTACNGKEGLEVYTEFKPDVIVSDIKMPEMDGLEMVRRIREIDGDTIILFTTALTSSADLKAGYLAGANNYIKKPFMPDEINAHVQSLVKLKEGRRSNNESGHIVLGQFILDAEHACLTNRHTGTKKMLTQREAQVLELLAANKNEVVRREALLSRFWGIEDKDYFASRSLDVFIRKIRTDIEDDPTLELRTVRGVGLTLLTKD